MTGSDEGGKQVKVTTRFKKDLRRAARQGKDAKALQDVVDTLVVGGELAEKHQPHPLKGNWKPCWECHIQPDWLLVWEEDEDHIILTRIGSHAELFE